MNDTPDQDPRPEKLCALCQFMLPASMFSPDSRTNDGLSVYCKDCRSETRDSPLNTEAFRPVVLCRKCGEFKARSEFHVKASSPSGLNPWCKECQNNYMRGYASTRRRLKRTDPSLEVILNVFELKYGTRDVRKVTLENDLVVLVEQVSKFMPHLTPQAILRKILKEAMPDNDSST